MSATITAAERGWVPDWMIRAGIRQLLRDRLSAERARANGDVDGALERALARMREAPIAVSPDAANWQHYEVPADFFRLVLGPRLKYSCGLWSTGATTLADAETAMLALTTSRADIQDGQRVLELGCGWGSLSLWLAERYPRAEIVAVSNAAGQRRFIEAECARRGLDNLRVVTADINAFATDQRFDRVVSVEMFEHLWNVERLLGRIASWLRPGGALFVHLFCHRVYQYRFEANGRSDWMARHFFTGGMMPAEDLLGRCASPLRAEARWRVDGRDYERTARAWLSNLDARRDDVERVLGDAGHPDGGRRAAERWRLFFLACAELFGYRGGTEWRVAHYRLRRADDAGA